MVYHGKCPFCGTPVALDPNVPGGSVPCPECGFAVSLAAMPTAGSPQPTAERQSSGKEAKDSAAPVIRCPTCSSKLRVPENRKARRIRCPKCSTIVDLRAQGSPTESPRRGEVGAYQTSSSLSPGSMPPENRAEAGQHAPSVSTHHVAGAGWSPAVQPQAAYDRFAHAPQVAPSTADEYDYSAWTEFVRRQTGSQASNPAQLPFSLYRAWLCFPTEPTRALVLALVFAGAAYWLHWLFGLHSFLCLLALALWILNNRSTAEAGDLCPGMVVSTSPYRVAVWADLTLGDGRHWPVIKIAEYPLERTRKGTFAPNELLPCATSYRSFEGIGHWLTINPVPAYCFTDNVNRISDAIRRIPQDEWQMLTQGWQQHGCPTEPSIYPLVYLHAYPLELSMWDALRSSLLAAIIYGVSLVVPLSLFFIFWSWWTVLLFVPWLFLTVMGGGGCDAIRPCAALLVDPARNLVAAYVNLSHSDEYRPAVAVTSVPSAITGGTTATPRSPVPMCVVLAPLTGTEEDIATTDPKKLRQLYELKPLGVPPLDKPEAQIITRYIPPGEWQLLDLCLRALPQPLPEGLHPVDPAFTWVEGGLFAVPQEDGYAVLKILKVDDYGVHVRLYANRFAYFPADLDESQLQLTPLEDRVTSVGHLPLSKATFASWKPRFIKWVPVHESELDGWRMWKENGGGYWGA